MDIIKFLLLGLQHIQPSLLGSLNTVGEQDFIVFGLTLSWVGSIGCAVNPTAALSVGAAHCVALLHPDQGLSEIKRIPLPYSPLVGLL